jgi:hypothetical protein
LHDRRPSILVVAARWWALTARLAAAFVQEGARVSVLCPPRHPLVHVRGLDGIHQHRGTDSAAMLRRVLDEVSPDVVVPGDDGIVAQLHALYAAAPELRALIERSLGPAASYRIADSRHGLMTLATELGLRAPRTQRVSSADDLAFWHRDVSPSAVLKVDGSCGGVGVRISHSIDESLQAWKDLRTRVDLATAWKRHIVDRDPLAHWTHLNRTAPEITIQELIPGQPANSMFACREGRILALVSVAVVASEGPTGAATIVRLVDDPDMAKAATAIAEALRLTGFYGLDFMLEDGSGRAHVIEMNPRCTQLGHLDLPGRGSLAAAFCAALRGEPKPRQREPIWSETIAFFPQVRLVGAMPIPLEGVHHDVPWDEAGLLAELLHDPWPQRQWLARIYHALRPLQRSAPVAHTDVGLPRAKPTSGMAIRAA